jgi:hypothetical protein
VSSTFSFQSNIPDTEKIIAVLKVADSMFPPLSVFNNQTGLPLSTFIDYEELITSEEGEIIGGYGGIKGNRFAGKADAEWICTIPYSLKVSIEELRVRAFMRMLRVGEGTVGEKGYETIFGGESFIKDHKMNWDTHPRIKVPFGDDKYSTAAGAYQVMGYNWDDSLNVAMRKKYGIKDFSPLSQDYYAVVLLKHARKKLGRIY